MIAAGEDRQHGGNTGYDDDPARYYSWDSTVPNHDKPAQGDTIVLWDKSALLGMSVIEGIQEGSSTKQIFRCPSCRNTKIKTRQKKEPRFRCHSRGCHHEFEDPVQEEKQVQTYRSLHEMAWVDLAGEVQGEELRELCHQPRSQHSIRELDRARYASHLETVTGRSTLRILSSAEDVILGGHGRAVVRVRKGQARFRRELLDLYGAACAFSGAQRKLTRQADRLKVEFPWFSRYTCRSPLGYSM